MRNSVMLEAPLEAGGTVQIEVFSNGGVRILGAKQVVVDYQIQPTLRRDGDSKGVTVVVTPLGHAVEVIFEPVSGMYWSSRGLAKPSFAAILQSDDQTIEVSSIDCRGKEKHVLGVVPPRAALV